VRLVHADGSRWDLPESARELVLDLARRARERARASLFDPNFRPALPDTPAAAAARHGPCAPVRRLYLCGETEAELLWPDGEIPVRTVIRVGSRARRRTGSRSRPPRTVAVVDEVGAGDAFAAGFAYASCRGGRRPLPRAGHVIAACASPAGDWETLPALAGGERTARSRLGRQTSRSSTLE